MMISFIVPAHNEQASLGRTLQAIHESARAVSEPYEIIVADDASTDATAEVARRNNARVLSVNHRQIAATRNAGASAAQGERLFFVDADTTIHPPVVASALRCMDKGAAGGGAPAQFDRTAPLYAQVLMFCFGIPMRVAGVNGGAFMFCTREAFRATGGFDERLFGAEDAAMSWALKREGRFVVLWRYVVTSDRRMRGMRGLQMLTTLIGMAFFPKMLRQRSRVKKIWYDSNREQDGIRDSISTRLFHGVMLLLIVAWVLPWDFFVPWSLTPRDSLPGKIRLSRAIFNCHIGLVLWPCGYFLLRNLFQQTRWLERIKSTVLLVVCLWFAWSATSVVVWFWANLW